MKRSSFQERLYGSHPAGEGGEYETLTLDSPIFSHRLKTVESEIVVTDPEPYPVAYLRVQKAVLEEKEGWIRPGIEELRRLLGMEELSDGLNAVGREVLEDMSDVPVGDVSAQEAGVTDISALSLSSATKPQDVWVKQTGRWFSAGVDGQTKGDEDVGSELRRCLDQIKSAPAFLSGRGRQLTC